MKEIYLFSGLGADEKAFVNLDFNGFKPVFIKWLMPLQNESIEHYAKRLLDQILSDKPILIGLSFGGIMAIEVAKLLQAEKVILISSVKTKNELPFYIQLAGKLKLQRMIPVGLLKRPGVIPNWFFGIESTADKKILAEILKDTDPKFLKWAMDKVVSWNNLKILENVKHIHGSKDRILPLRYLQPDVVIEGGGHLMTLNNYEVTMLNIQLFLD